jgi:hypothetical protein
LIVDVVVDPSAIVMELGVAEILKSGLVNVGAIGERFGETYDESFDVGVKWDGAGSNIRATMTNISPIFGRVKLEDRDFGVWTVEFDKVRLKPFLGDLAFATAWVFADFYS